MEEPLRVGIAGLGLIGGSVALALAERGLPWYRLGYDPDAQTLAHAQARGVVHAVLPSLEALAIDCDLLLLCQPVPALLEDLPRLARLPRLPVVCDVASVKASVLAAADAALGARRGVFVGAHPIAGSEQSGFGAARADLFTGRRVVLCEAGADATACQRVRQLWSALGAELQPMGAAHHDEIYAAVSHLPQLLTWAYAGALAQLPAGAEALAFAGPGFASFTRLGASSPALWAGIALHNRQPLLAALQAVAARVAGLHEALAHADGPALRRQFEEARALLARPANPGGNHP